MVNLLEPGTLRVWDLACGGNSEIYQGPQGARSYRARVRLGRIRDALLTISTRGIAVLEYRVGVYYSVVMNGI